MANTISDNTGDSFARTPKQIPTEAYLDSGIRSRDIDVVSKAITLDADLGGGIVEGPESLRWLVLAMVCNFPEAVQALCKAGADVDRPYFNEHLLLHAAALSFGSTEANEIVRTLHRHSKAVTPQILADAYHKAIMTTSEKNHSKRRGGVSPHVIADLEGFDPDATPRTAETSCRKIAHQQRANWNRFDV